MCGAADVDLFDAAFVPPFFFSSTSAVAGLLLSGPLAAAGDNLLVEAFAPLFLRSTTFSLAPLGEAPEPPFLRLGMQTSIWMGESAVGLAATTQQTCHMLLWVCAPPRRAEKGQ